MDVRCERCQTEYEIEDAHISELGTDVQCGDCGHLFTVKRSAAPTGRVASVSGEARDDGTWTLLTRLGQTLTLRDLGQLHKWIVERRVTREDRITHDGQSWQTLGQVSELAPFFDIVDSAERARSLQPPEPSAPLVPLQPPILIPPVQERGAPATQKPGSPQVSGGSSGDSLGALPQAADADETDMISVESGRSHKLLKLAIMVAVASGIGYGGILWQKHHLPPAAILSSGTTADVPTQATSAAVSPRSLAAESGAGEAESATDQAGEASVEPSPSAVAPQSFAAQAYVALGHHQYLQAIKLFHKELAQSPNNGTALFGLAEAYRAAGKKQRALKAYRRYVEILPFGPDMGSARFHIRRLEAKMR